MFRKLVLIASLIVPSFAYSQVIFLDKKMVCGTLKDVFTEIAKSQYKELPVWIGNSTENIKVLLVLNEKTKTWSIVQFDDKIACLLSVGTDSSFYQDQK